jgi:hypothetical protein
MVALQPVPHHIRFACKGSHGDDIDVLNIFHVAFAEDGPYSPAELASAAQEMATIYGAGLVGAMSEDYSFLSCTAKDISVPNGGEATFVEPAPIAGGVASHSMAANCALVISWKEDISYRGGHPRTYLPAIPASVLNDPQHVTPAYRTTVQVTANSLITSVSGGSWGSGLTDPVLSVVHYRLDGALLTPPVGAIIRSAVVDTRLDSQRRRLGS